MVAPRWNVLLNSTDSGWPPSSRSQHRPAGGAALLGGRLHHGGQVVRDDPVQGDAIEADHAQIAGHLQTEFLGGPMTPAANRSLCAMIAVGRWSGSSSSAWPAIIPSST